ncbi:MAG: hypothetical protein ACYTG2_00955 [Planctomycetota bacterium]
MPHASESRPRREFPREGFTLYLDPDGIEVQVDDYHPQPLKLTWALIEQLRRESQAPRSTGEGGAA